MIESNRKKDEIIIKQDSALVKADERDSLRIGELKIKDQIIEESKPKWWQHPTAITSIGVLAFIIGILVGI